MQKRGRHFFAFFSFSQNNFHFSLRLYGCKGKTKRTFNTPVSQVPADEDAPSEYKNTIDQEEKETKTMKKLFALILAVILACGMFTATSFAARTAALDSETVLYYIPGVSQFYHTDPNCSAVGSNLCPMQGTFTCAEINDEAYRSLKPCRACGAPKRELAAAAPVSASLFEYNVKADGTAVITKVKKNYNIAQIPAELDGHKVTAIGQDAFNSNYGLTSVIVPEGVTRIDSHAFAYMDRLEEITLPESLTTIDTQAFFFSERLKSINIPAALTSIDSGAFCWCDSLNDFRVDPANPVFEVRAGVLANKKENILVYHPVANDKVYTVPGSFEKIGEDAFFHNSMTEIIIPDSVKSIGSSAFFQCALLKTARLPEGLEVISRTLFSQCVSLETLTIPDGVKRIEDSAFFNCHNLKELVIPASVTHIGSDAFKDCTKLTIKAPAGSFAQRYCERNNIPFEELK